MKTFVAAAVTAAALMVGTVPVALARQQPAAAGAAARQTAVTRWNADPGTTAAVVPLGSQGEIADDCYGGLTYVSRGGTLRPTVGSIGFIRCKGPFDASMDITIYRAGAEPVTRHREGPATPGEPTYEFRGNGSRPCVTGNYDSSMHVHFVYNGSVHDWNVSTDWTFIDCG